MAANELDSQYGSRTVELAVLIAFKAGASVSNLSDVYHKPVKEIESIIREELKKS